MADVNADTAGKLRGLAVGDSFVLESLIGAQLENLEASGLDPRASSLVKIATLVALDARPAQDRGRGPRAHARAGDGRRRGRGPAVIRRRRPLLRAAAVGGAAYYTGKKASEGRQREAEQEQRITDLEAQQQAHPAAQPTPGAPAPSMDDKVKALEQLAQLRDQGILTEEEFAQQKQRILEG